MTEEHAKKGDDKPIQAPDRDSSLTLNLLLPMRRYKLTVRHVLLAKLGGISHFILAVLASEGGTIEDFARISGLTLPQYQPLLERLMALSLIANDSLTSKGQHLANILRDVHEQSTLVWLDAHSPSYPVMVMDGSLLSEKHPDVKNEYVLRARHKADRYTDSNYQRMRLNKNLATYLHAAFPHCKPISEEKSSPLSEWEISLESESIVKDRYLVIIVRREDAVRESNSCIEVLSPISSLETEWSRPADLPATIKLHVPDEKIHFYCNSIGNLIKEEELLSVSFSGHEVADEFIWPALTADLKQRSVKALFESLVDLDFSQSSPLLNRNHKIGVVYERLMFSWQKIHERCREDSRVIHAGS